MSGCGCPLTAEMTGGHPSEQQTCQPAVPSAVMASLCIWQRKKGAIGLKHGSVQAERAWLNKCNLYFRTGDENTNPPLLKFAQLPLITHMVGERVYAPSAQNTCFLMTFSVWPASKHAGLFLIRL